MAVLEILQYPDPRLRRKALLVENVTTPRIKRVISDMFETLAHTDNCAGLSATQLDMEDPPAITVISATVNNDQKFCLINPLITQREGTSIYPEGCMSVYPDCR